MMVRRIIADLNTLRRQLKENDEQRFFCRNNPEWNILQAQRVEILQKIKAKAEALAGLANAGIKIETELLTTQVTN